MLSPLDDYPVHQIAETMRHVGTSDRHFYDRYYFNCHRGDGGLFLITGLGQYPNLGVVDAFAALRTPEEHLVVRASRALAADRMDVSCGPFRIEVLQGLSQLRLTLDHGDLSFDLTFAGDIPATLEPRHFQRQLERVVFDSMRFAQTGTWTGHLFYQGERHAVTPDVWRGNRDRSWGVRPVGEAEPPGRRAEAGYATFFWIYSVMRFDDFSIIVIMQEDEHGRRVVEEAVRVWPDETVAPQSLGRPEHKLTFAPGGRDVVAAQLTFGALAVDCELLLPLELGVSTGYGHLEPGWRHGMWQGDLVVQSVRKAVADIDLPARMFCPVDHLARFHLTEDGGSSRTGMGLFEVAVIGPHAKYGFSSFLDTWEGP